MPTPESSIEVVPTTLEQARIAIAYIRQNVAQMGSNDIEFPTIDQISDKLEKGELKPEIAVGQANRVFSGKQGHH